ncbi:hypothetical protein LSM04_008098 [Trypanosoma melophagium]|uniref:uncharacterized protein n=1 Tax=Trypanosoma melophagium TaxID=715481 RepID=UPI00351A799F|nr:hypothetical protein LSM04_008098 [Trypanosoma melophagium]
MSALDIACSGAFYNNTCVLDIMKYRCMQTQPVNTPSESSSHEEVEEAAEVEHVEEEENVESGSEAE